MLSESAKQIAWRLDYVKIGDRVPFPETWKRLLNEWCSAMDEYIKQSQDMCGWVRERGGDLPYWYAKEETNIGFLAAAAWRLGGVALQEFEVTRPEGKGQGDLWIKLGDLGCHIEAKGTDSPTTSKDSVEQALSNAKNQLILPPNEKANVGMAVCFVVPAIIGSTFDFRELVSQFEGDDSIVAVYLPDRTLDLQYEEYNYPGVALIGQVVWPK